MKNQYVADIGDFGKYSLLRAFCKEGIAVGVNWYLTDKDESNDGKATQYLQSGQLRHYEPAVFDALKEINDNPDKTIIDVQNSGILPGARFYDAMLKPDGKPKERAEERKQWFEKSIDALADSELIFMDPDNGLLEAGDAGKLHAEKYVLVTEVEAYYNAGKNVVYYCHRGRRSLGAWLNYISLMFERIPDALPVVMTYRKGSSRSYIFLIHPEFYKRYRKILDAFRSNWYRLFSEEYTNQGNVAGKKVGEALKLERSNGVTVSIQVRADGQVEIKSSDQPTRSSVMSIDYFCSRILY